MTTMEARLRAELEERGVAADLVEEIVEQALAAADLLECY